MTESAKIAAANNYSRDVAAADAAYNQGMGELNHYLRTEQERLDDKAKAEQDEIYGEVMTKIESGEFNTTTELSSYLNDKTIDTDGDGVAESSFLDLMSPAQRATVQGKLSYYQKKPEQIAADEEYYKTHNADGSVKNVEVNVGESSDVGGYLNNTNAGNNFTIGGHLVELGEEVADGVVPASKVSTIDNKVPFVYNGAIFIKIDEKVYSVRKRQNAEDDTSYNYALKYLTDTNTTTKNITIIGLMDDILVGNDFKIKTTDGDEYKVELGDCIDSFPAGVADHIKNGSIFKYGDKLYYKTSIKTLDGRESAYFEVRGRKNQSTTDYQNALNFYRN